MQVKEYHRKIADKKFEKAIKKCKDEKGIYPQSHDYYFYLYDVRGCPKKEKEQGYVAFYDKVAIYRKNIKEAIVDYLKH